MFGHEMATGNRFEPGVHSVPASTAIANAFDLSEIDWMAGSNGLRLREGLEATNLPSSDVARMPCGLKDILRSKPVLVEPGTCKAKKKSRTGSCPKAVRR